MPNLKPFATYNPEGDTFTLHFYMGKQIGGVILPCLRCGQTMAGLVGPLGICSGGPTTNTTGVSCNQTIFPSLFKEGFNGIDKYHDYEVSAETLCDVRWIANQHLMNIEPPEGDFWNVDGLTALVAEVDKALADANKVQLAMLKSKDVVVCAQCGFKEPCSCAAFSQQEVN